MLCRRTRNVQTTRRSCDARRKDERGARKGDKRTPIHFVSSFDTPGIRPRVTPAARRAFHHSPAGDAGQPEDGFGMSLAAGREAQSMDGFAHVFLHVALCKAMVRAAPATTFAMHVRMAFRTGDTQFNKSFSVSRGDGSDAVVEFDVPRGVYRVLVEAPKYGCTASDFLEVLPDANRNVNETLVDGPPAPPQPVMLLDGTAPTSFLYVRPTFVLLDKNVACNQPIGPLVTSPVRVEYDQGSYYVWLYSDPQMERQGQYTVALRLRTPASTAHYVRLPFAFPTPWAGFPGHIQMNVSEDMIAGLATEKVDTLLCPKLWQSSAH